MVILLTLYFIIALLSAVIFTYYTNDGDVIGLFVILSVLWPLVMPFIIVCIIFCKDVREELDSVFKK